MAAGTSVAEIWKVGCGTLAPTIPGRLADGFRHDLSADKMVVRRFPAWYFQPLDRPEKTVGWGDFGYPDERAGWPCFNSGACY
jgi:hypothetical protein